jgi:hypothetical protein
MGMTRITIACVPRCLKMLTRNRASPGTLNERSAEPVFSKLSTAVCWFAIISFAIPAVCAGVNFSKPAIRTGTKFPVNSICGGRPGLKIRSLTLPDARSISRKIAMKFNGGGAGGWLLTFGCSLLILFQELFTLLERQKNGARRTNYFRSAYIKVVVIEGAR